MLTVNRDEQAEAVRRLLAVRDHISAHPEEANERNWCGTDCCVAGHLVRQRWPDAEVGFSGELHGSLGVEVSPGSWVEIEDAAASVIGFDRADMSNGTGDLFYDFCDAPPGTPAHAEAMGKRIERFIRDNYLPDVVAEALG